MSYVWQRWLLRELREAAEPLGIRVIAVQGWENRGRPASTGHFDPDGQHTVHHTGATTSSSSPMPTLRTLIEGRSDLPGPLSQVGVAFNGDIYVVAAGRANHAGRIGKAGVAGMPAGGDGNALAIGDEVDTNGTQALPPAQVRSIALVSHVVTSHHDKPASWVHRHQDISDTGKWDLGSRTTNQLRDDAEQIAEELDMPSAEEIANAVWNREVTVKGGRVRAGRVLAQVHSRTNVGPLLKALAEGLDKLAEESRDDATKVQVRRLRGDVDALSTELLAHDADEG